MNQLAVSNGQDNALAHPATRYDLKDVALFKQTFADENFTDEEVKFILKYCVHTGLDVFMRQAHFWKQQGKLIVHPSIDGLRALASRSEVEATRIDIMWCGPDGNWKDIWLDNETPPVAARARYRVKGYDELVTAVVLWEEFKRTYKDKRTGEQKLMPLWKEKPAHMLGKCADAQGIRVVFPQVSLLMENLNSQARLFNEAQGVDFRLSAEPPPDDEPQQIEGQIVDDAQNARTASQSDGNGDTRVDSQAEQQSGANGDSARSEPSEQQTLMSENDDREASLEECLQRLSRTRSLDGLQKAWDEIEAVGWNAGEYAELEGAKVDARRRIARD